MVKNNNTDGDKTVDGAENTDQPTPRLRIPLKTANDVSRELGRLYRQMKSGQIVPTDGTKLAYVLNLLRQSIETSDIETRLQALEQVTELTKDKTG